MTVNKRTTMAMLFVFAVGVAGGAFFEVFIEGGGKDQLMDLLSLLFSGGGGGGFIVAFWRSFRLWAVVIAVIALAAVWRPLAALCPAFPLIRGLMLGFSTTMIIEAFGLPGFRHVALTLLPQSLIQIPVLCILIAAVFDAGRRRPSRSVRGACLGQCLAAALLIMISCLLEACLTRFLL